MVETEKGIVSLLLTSENWDSIYDILIPEAFENNFCRNCYEILLDEHRAKSKHDITLLVRKLQNKIKGSLEIEITTALKEIIDTNTLGLFSVKSAETLMSEYNARKVNAILTQNQINGANLYEEIDRIGRAIQDIKSPAQVGMDMTDFVKEFDGKYFTFHEESGVRTGFKCFDDFLDIDGGDMVVIGARPAVGKTALAIQLAEQMADLDKKVLVFNLEMVEKQIFERMLSTEMGFSLTKIKRADSLAKEEVPIYQNALKRIMSRKLRFITGSQKVSDIRMSTRKIKPDVVIIDYLQLVKSDVSYGGNRYAEVGDISHELKALAVELKIPIFVLTQLNRVAKATTEPSMNEIRESGDIEQDASIILLLWNADENDYSKKGVKIDKNRQGQLYKWNDRFVFDGDSMRFVDKEDFHSPSDNEIMEIPQEEVLGIEETEEKIEEQEVKEEQIVIEEVETNTAEIETPDADDADFEFLKADTELPW